METRGTSRAMKQPQTHYNIFRAGAKSLVLGMLRAPFGARYTRPIMPMMKRLLLGGLVALGAVPGSTVVLGAGEPAQGGLPPPPLLLSTSANSSTLTVSAVTTRDGRPITPTWRSTAWTWSAWARMLPRGRRRFRKLRVGAMPPAGLPRPSAEAYEAFIVSWNKGSIAPPRRPPTRVDHRFIV